MMNPQVATITNLRDMARFDSAIPVHLDGGHTGITHDVSPQGLYFFADAPLMPGESFPFSLEFTDPAGRLWMRGVGRVMRVEARGEHHGIAAEIVDSRLERD